MSVSPTDVELTVIHSSGVVRSISTSSFETVRSVLVQCGFCPLQVLVVTNRHPLQLDLSLACQGITSGTSIYVFVARALSDPSRRHFRASSIHSEQLRLADLGFLPFENGRAQRRLMLLLTKLADDDLDDAPDEEETNIGQESRISEEPLPTLWPAPAPGEISPRVKRDRAMLR
jgi:hypothetical protein